MSKETATMFDEAALRKAIVGVWGEYGAHTDLFDMLLADSRRKSDRIKELEDALRDTLTAFEDLRRPQNNWDGWELHDGTPIGDRFDELEARARVAIAGKHE